MKKTLKNISMAATLLAASTLAHASPINIGGVIFDPSSFFDFSSNGNIVEVTTATAGEMINGFGIITNMNNSLQPVFCPGCELTFEFGGYELESSLAGTIGEPFSFTGGWLKVYVDHTPNYTALTEASATDGTLWLDLLAVDVFGSNAGHTLTGTLGDPVSVNGVLQLSGEGEGKFDVVGGGMADAHFNTNEEPFGRDLTYTSSFQPYTQGATPEGFTHFGSFDMAGNAIPEPSTIALFGLSVLGLGFARRRNRKA